MESFHNNQTEAAPLIISNTDIPEPSSVHHVHHPDALGQHENGVEAIPQSSPKRVLREKTSAQLAQSFFRKARQVALPAVLAASALGGTATKANAESFGEDLLKAGVAAYVVGALTNRPGQKITYEVGPGFTEAAQAILRENNFDFEMPAGIQDGRLVVNPKKFYIAGTLPNDPESFKVGDRTLDVSVTPAGPKSVYVAVVSYKDNSNGQMQYQNQAYNQPRQIEIVYQKMVMGRDAEGKIFQKLLR